MRQMVTHSHRLCSRWFSPSSRPPSSKNKPIYILFFLSSRFLTGTSIEDLNPESIPSNYVKTMIRLTVKEIKFRLIADNMLSTTPQSQTTQVRKNEKLLCCLFLNNTTFSLLTGYGWWEISCGINNLALKDYTSNQQKLKYIICRNDDYHHSSTGLSFSHRWFQIVHGQAWCDPA